MDARTLRSILAEIGALVLALIWGPGRRPAPPQGRRVPSKPASERTEPQFGDVRIGDDEGLDPEIAAELDRLGREIKGDDAADDASPRQSELRIDMPESDDARPAPVYVESNIGARASVTAPEGAPFAGSDIIVAAEKTGLVYGALGVFHRMPATTSEYGAVFSVANMMRPGRFEMGQIQSLRTGGLSLFMVMPNALCSGFSAFAGLALLRQ